MEKIRISKLLSTQGLCSRREADLYIEQGLVTVDGEVVTELGTRAFAHQKIELKNKLKNKSYMIFCKSKLTEKHCSKPKYY